jgi:Phosphate transporter family
VVRHGVDELARQIAVFETDPQPGHQRRGRMAGRRRVGKVPTQGFAHQLLDVGTPFQGFCAETGGAITLFAATHLGIPVSTTHTITGCIIGVGAARKVSSVRWNVANRIVVAWIVTIPAAAFIAALVYALAGLSPPA